MNAFFTYKENVATCQFGIWPIFGIQLEVGGLGSAKRSGFQPTGTAKG